MSMENQIETKPKASFRAVSSGLLQRNCSSCQKKQLLQRSALQNKPETKSPIVHDALRSAGEPLDADVRALMEPRFGHDFSEVRIHNDDRADESARVTKALAFTVGDNIAFAKGRYAPNSEKGRKLLAHELTHVVQQSRGSLGSNPESSADRAAGMIASGGYLTPEMIGSAPPGLYPQENEDRKEGSAPVTRPAFRLNWDGLSQSGMFQLRQPSLRGPALTPPSQISLLPPSQLTSTPPLGPPSSKVPGPMLLPPAGASQKQDESAPQMPSRLSIASSGSFSLGLRLGFPSSEAKDIPGMAGSALAESMRRAEIMNQTLTGRVPSSWEALDKAQLAGALWGIFSTRIAPDLARNITSRLTTSTGRPGASYELDLVLLTDFSGGGLSFGVKY
jgi:hypothetical protein